jgi:hypothetical protein
MRRSDCWWCGKFLNVYPVCRRMSTFQRHVPNIFVSTWSAILRELMRTDRDVAATTVPRVNRRWMLRSCWAAFCVNGIDKVQSSQRDIWIAYHSATELTRDDQRLVPFQSPSTSWLLPIVLQSLLGQLWRRLTSHLNAMSHVAWISRAGVTIFNPLGCSLIMRLHLFFQPRVTTKNGKPVHDSGSKKDVRGIFDVKYSLPADSDVKYWNHRDSQDSCARAIIHWSVSFVCYSHHFSQCLCIGSFNFLMTGHQMFPDKRKDWSFRATFGTGFRCWMSFYWSISETVVPQAGRPNLRQRPFG